MNGPRPAALRLARVAYTPGSRYGVRWSPASARSRAAVAISGMPANEPVSVSAPSAVVASVSTTTAAASAAVPVASTGTTVLAPSRRQRWSTSWARRASSSSVAMVAGAVRSESNLLRAAR